MNGRAILLHAHIVATSQNFAISRDEACSNGHAAFAGALFGFFEGCLETCVGLGHVGWMMYRKIDWERNVDSHGNKRIMLLIVM
jgi:hypothetical protein